MSLAVLTLSGELPVDASLRPPTRAEIEAVRPFSHDGGAPIYVGTHVTSGSTVITGRGLVEPDDDGCAEQTIPCLPQPGLEPNDARWRLRLHWTNGTTTDHILAVTEDTSWSRAVYPDA